MAPDGHANDEGNKPSLYIIFVRGLFSSGDSQKPWLDSRGVHVLEHELRNSYPKAKLLTIDQESSGDGLVFRAIVTRAAHLVETLSDEYRDADAPIVFLCHGLGGYVVFKALSLPALGSSEGNHGFLKHTTALLLFGTPLNFDKRKRFTAAIQACGTVELGTRGQVEYPDNEAFELYTQWIKAIQPGVRVVSVAEGLRCHYRGTGTRRYKQRSKVIVDEEVARLDRATCLKATQDHHNIGICNHENYEKISQVIDEGIAAFSPSVRGVDAGNALSPRPRVRERQATSIHYEEAQVSVKVPAVTTFDQLPKSARHYIPFPENPHFLGRDDILATLKQHLVGGDPYQSSERRAFALWAGKGFGKSQIARRFAAMTADDFHFILWVQADEKTGILESYSKYAGQLGLVKDPTDFDAATKALQSWFQKLEQRFLVIFDSAYDANLINTWWPHGKMGSILITTVDQVFATSNVAGNGAQLGTIDEEDAIQLVLSQVSSHARNDEDQGRTEALEIVRKVGHLPLVIQDCVGLINETGRTLRQYNRLRPDKDAVLRGINVSRANRPYAPYPLGFIDTVRERLERLDTDAQGLINVFSLLHPYKIPEIVFEPTNLPEDLSQIGFLSNFESCITQVSKGLVTRGEAKRKDDTDLSNLFMHDLHHEFVRKEMDKDARQAAFDVASRLVSLAIDPSNFPKGMPSRAADRKYFLEYFSHVESIRGFCETFWESKTLQIPASFIMLLNLSSWLCYAAGFFKDGLAQVQMAERILDHLREDSKSPIKVPDPYYMVEAERGIYHNHACIATEIGDFNLSLEYFHKEMTVYQNARSSGIKFPNGTNTLSVILGGIANSYQGQGNHEAAEVHYKKCFESHSGYNRIHFPYEVNICRSQWARGANDEASSALEGLLKLREESYGPNDTKDYIVGHMKYVLGNVRIDQGRMDEAFQLHESARDCWLATLGKSHHKTGDVLHKVGWHLCRLGRYEEARDALQSALEVYNSGKDQSFWQAEIARSSWKMGQVLLKLNRTEEALGYIEEAQRIKKSLRAQEGFTKKEEASEVDYDMLVSLWAR